MSMYLRNVYQTITEEYGFPPYVAYILFGVATIVIGSILGVLMVFFVDYFMPFAGGAGAPPAERSQQQEVHKIQVSIL